MTSASSSLPGDGKTLLARFAGTFCWGRPAAHMYGFSNASTRIMPIVTPQFVTLRLYWELEVTLLIFIVSMAWWIRPKATICAGMPLEWKLVAATCMLLGVGMHACCSQAEGCWLTCLKNKIQTVKGNSTQFLCGSPGTLFSCKLATIKLRLWAPSVGELALRISRKARDSLELESELQINFSR